MLYTFDTDVTMKPYNCKNFYICPDVILRKTIEADNRYEALTKWAEWVNQTSSIAISRNALRNKRPMYIDTSNGPQQVGYVITGYTDFDVTAPERNGGCYTESRQYIDLWVTVTKCAFIVK